MNLDDLTLGQIKQLQNVLGTQESLQTQDLGKQIVILQRGWVFVGDLKKTGAYMELTNASNVRKWGTTKGLGELAENGPLVDTVLDKTPTVKFHELTVIGMLQCNQKNW